MSRIPPVPKNVIEPIPDGRERFTDIRFPILGIDVSQELESQRPGTTPSGDNVRTFEKITYRGRGGVRPGLSKFLNDQVAPIPDSNPQPIQNLTVVIDPSGALFPFPFNDVPGEWFDNSDPSNLGRNLIFDGYVGDVYDGGSGFLPNKKKPPVPKIVITPNSFSKQGGTNYVFDGTEFSVDDGITKYRTYLGAQVTAAEAEKDKRDSAVNDAQQAYDDNPSDATAAYLQACVIAAAKAASALVAAQALKAKADAAEVQTVELSSEGAPAAATPGPYPITGKNAKGIGLDLFRLKYNTGTMTVGGGYISTINSSTSGEQSEGRSDLGNLHFVIAVGSVTVTLDIDFSDDGMGGVTITGTWSVPSPATYGPFESPHSGPGPVLIFSINVYADADSGSYQGFLNIAAAVTV